MSIQLLQANVLKRLAKNTKKTSRFTVDRILESKQAPPPPPQILTPIERIFLCVSAVKQKRVLYKST